MKVISAQEMARIEKAACADGASEQAFMEQAAEGIARAVESFVEMHGLPKIATVLAGKGNNGGDAYATGVRLIQRGFQVSALHIYPTLQCSPLCKTMYEKFCSHGGQVRHAHDEKSLSFEQDGVILDGLVGTGFKGKPDVVLALAIEQANKSGLPIFAIDIPSGLDGTTGEVETVAIQATETISLGLPKMGFFLKGGWDHVGALRHVDFGLGAKYIAAAAPLAHLLEETELALPPIKRTRHKYQAGYVLAVAGSPGMPGAALLAAYTALRSGAGIVRLFHPRGMEAELASAPFELIRQAWNGKDIRALSREAKRAKSLLIGPGIGKTKEAGRLFKNVLENIALPMVIDADALFFLAEHSSWKLPRGSVLTPHRGEMALLLSETPDLETCQRYTEEKGVTIVLKGAPTFVFHPKETPLIITQGDPGMATAGSGDVLTGVIAALMAQGLEAKKAAPLAAYLHGRAGEHAASSLTSYCMTASDLIDFLPDVFSQLLSSFSCGRGGS